jgi:hydroxyethylthiazole kinase-like uncharacterized protein yjeF
LASWPLPVPEHGDKEARGSVLVIGGSPQMIGGAILAATAALRSGAGKLQIATVASAAIHLASEVPEAYVVGLSERKDGAVAASGSQRVFDKVADVKAVLIGPGMVNESEVTKIVKRLVPQLKDATLILDAAALAALSKDNGAVKALNGNAVITPHFGEMAMITGLEKAEVKRAAPEIACRVAAESQCVVALKSETTFVVGPDSDLFRNDAGSIGLATSGSGDTLSGVIAGLIARGATPLQATAWGVYVHARAGERLAKRIGRIGYLARELLAEVPVVLQQLER